MPEKPVWIEEAEHAACIAVAEELKHTQWSGAIVLAALRAFMEKVPLKGEPALNEHKYADHFKNAETLRQLKEAFK